MHGGGFKIVVYMIVFKIAFNKLIIGKQPYQLIKHFLFFELNYFSRGREKFYSHTTQHRTKYFPFI